MRKRPARIKKPVSVVAAAPPKTGSVTRRFAVLAVAMIVTVGAGMLIRSGQAATFQGPSQAPPGGNIPVTIWNAVATGSQQTSASISIDGGGPAGTNPVGLSVGSNAADLGAAAAGQNVIYGVGDPVKMHAADYLLLLQAPAGTNRFSVNESGNVVANGGVTAASLTVSGLSNFGTAALNVASGQRLLFGNVDTASIGDLMQLQKESVDQFRVTSFGDLLLRGDMASLDNTFTISTFSGSSMPRLAFTDTEIRVGTNLNTMDLGFDSQFIVEGSENSSIGDSDIASVAFSNDSNRAGQTNLPVASVTAFVDQADGTNTGWLKFKTKDGTTLQERMEITSAGKVGINTTITSSPPGYRLDVRESAGAGGAAIIRIHQDNPTKLYTGLRLDRTAAAERWFMGMNDVDDKWRLRKSPTPADVLIVDTAGNVNVNGGGLSTFANDITPQAATIETAEMCLGNSATGNEAFCRTAWPMGVDSYDPAICFGPVYVGDTGANSTGNVGTGPVSGFTGYRRANELCSAAHGAGAHVCSIDEILTSIKCAAAPLLAEANGQYFWINGGPPGYTAPAKDCEGWTSAAGTALGRIWQTNSNNGGLGSLTTCGAPGLPFACCK